MSRLDRIYRRLVLTGFFTKGWGNPDQLKRIIDFRKIIANREKCQHLVPVDYPIIIDREKVEKDYIIQEGHFMSPLDEHLPGIMPSEVQTARFQVILPKQWRSDLRPICLHLAGTGDHYFTRRRALMAKPLLKETGIGSILLENPFYGSRKPKQQLRSSLHNVSDLFVMGGALVLESLALFHWCERQGYGPLGITGISMGGHMASLAATNWCKPISLIPCLSWTTASSVFLKGVMSAAIPWKLLEAQYLQDNVYSSEIMKKIFSPEFDISSSYQLGRQFLKNYPHQYTDDISETHKVHEKSTAVANNGNMKDDFVLGKEVGLNSSHQKSSFHTSSEATSQDEGGRVKQRKFIQVTNIVNQSMSMAEQITRKLMEQTPSWPRTPTKEKSFEQSTIKGLGNEEKQILRKESLDFMRGLMDECTHIGNFSCPVDPSLIIIVLADNDAYYPRDGVKQLNEIWPGAEVRSINAGHISAFLFKQNEFRKAIRDSFNRQIMKYHPTKDLI